MKCFNFGNEETHYFTMWMLHSQVVNVDALIEEALQRVESSEGHQSPGGVSMAAQEELARLIEEKTAKYFADWIPTGRLPDEAPPEAYQDGLDSLFVPLLVCARSRIFFMRAARALFMATGDGGPALDRNKREYEPAVPE